MPKLNSEEIFAQILKFYVNFPNKLYNLNDKIIYGMIPYKLNFTPFRKEDFFLAVIIKINSV